MADSDIYGKVTELVQPILDSLGLELVELEFKKSAAVLSCGCYR